VNLELSLPEVAAEAVVDITIFIILVVMVVQE
jgi:hypothetical protein